MEVGLPGNNNCIFLIQARIHSSRLPGKILFKFFDLTIIERIIKVTKQVSPKKNIFIISGNLKKNNYLRHIAKKNKISIYFGNEKNVFLRFKNFLKLNFNKKYNYVYRITSDNYLLQPKIIKIMLKEAIKKRIDYGYVKPLSHYSGEIISKKLFFNKFKLSKMACEHVTWDFRRNKKIKILAYPKNFLKLNHTKSLTLDTVNDLIQMKIIENKYKGLKKINNFNYFQRIEKTLLKN